MVQMVSSETLWHWLQYCISFTIRVRAVPKASAASGFSRSRCSTMRMAVFLPMPGSLATSLMAFSISVEGMFIYSTSAEMPRSQMACLSGIRLS